MIQRVGVPVRDGGPGDYNAYWRMPRWRDEANGYPVPIPPGATWIGMDPGTSSPFAQVAIDVPGLGPSLLAPGGVLPIHEKCKPLTMWNVHHSTMRGGYLLGYWDGVTMPVAGYLAPTVFGRASLVCGDAASLPAWLDYTNKIKATIKAGAILNVAVVATGRVMFPTNGIKGIRVSAWPGDAAGAPLGAIPADFSVTLFREAWVLDLAGQNIAGGPVLDFNPKAGALAVASELGTGTVLTSTGIGTLPPMVDLSVTTESFAAGLRVSALAGAAVASVILSVEGY